MISQPLPNFKTQFFFQKQEAGSYDNIALNQRYALVYIYLVDTILLYKTYFYKKRSNRPTD